MRSRHSEEIDISAPIAAIDLGSNSFHLIVARLDHGELRPIERLGEKVQLAAGFDEQGNLTEEAIERGLSCLRKLAQYCDGMPNSQIRVVGTNALRKAGNREIFVRRAMEILGHPVNIIAGREEARLIYLGVAHTQSDDRGKQLVIDIGGGSTEFIIGERFEPLLLESLNMGCVTWTQKYFADGHVTEKQFDEAYYSARLELIHIEEAYREHGWDYVTGSSGSIKSICNILAARGQNGITRADLYQLKKELFSFKRVGRIMFNGLKPDRAPIFPAGLAILCATFDSLEIECMGFSEGALREGLLYDMVGRSNHEDVRERTLRALQKRYHVDTSLSERALENFFHIFKAAESAWHLSDEDYELVYSALMVHEVGLDISHVQYHRHGAYIINNTDMLGFTTNEQQHLAMLVRGHRRSYPLQPLFQLANGQGKGLLELMILLRVSILLGRAHVRTDQPTYTCTFEKKKMTITFIKDWLADNPLTNADLEQESAYVLRTGYKLIIC